MAAAEAELGDGGRVLLRASGTEPLVRVMVEAGDEETARSVVERLVEAVRQVPVVPAPAPAAEGEAAAAPTSAIGP